MVPLRRIRVNFEFVCNNIPIMYYPIHFLYIFRGRRCCLMYGFSSHPALLHIYTCSRLFRDYFHTWQKTILWDNGYVLSGPTKNPPRIRTANGIFNIGSHIKI